MRFIACQLLEELSHDISMLLLSATLYWSLSPVLIEESSIPDRHAGLDTVSFGFNGWCDHAPIGAVVGGNDNGFAPEQKICLLFNGRKAGIEVNMHDSGLIAIDGKRHINDNCILFANNVRTYNESITQRLKSQGL
jgi:hypothetical protein